MLAKLMPYVLGVSALAVGALFVALRLEQGENARLTLDLSNAKADLQVAERRLALAQHEASVLAQRAVLQAETQARLDALREALSKGDFGNAVIPDEFRIGFICRLLPASPHCGENSPD